jgi:hypothetical protein
MRFSIVDTRNTVIAALLIAAAGLLCGCQTAGPSGPSAQAEKAPEPPMTRARAAETCWMMTEKGHASTSLDKRADIVTKCIDDKMKAAAAPKS